MLKDVWPEVLLIMTTLIGFVGVLIWLVFVVAPTVFVP